MFVQRIRGRDNSVGIVTSLRTRRSGARIPEKQEIYLFFKMYRIPVGPTKPPMRRVPGATIPRVKWHVREAAHSFPSNVKVKNAWSSNASPPTGFMHCLGAPLPVPLSVVYIYTIMFYVFVNSFVLLIYLSMRG